MTIVTAYIHDTRAHTHSIWICLCIQLHVCVCVRARAHYSVNDSGHPSPRYRQSGSWPVDWTISASFVWRHCSPLTFFVILLFLAIGVLIVQCDPRLRWKMHFKYCQFYEMKSFTQQHFQKYLYGLQNCRATLIELRKQGFIKIK